MKKESKFLISETFKLTNRGIVLAGIIQTGTIKKGDFITFKINNDIHLKSEILNIEAIKSVNPNINIGLIINCISENEIEQMEKWKPNNQVALISTI